MAENVRLRRLVFKSSDHISSGTSAIYTSICIYYCNATLTLKARQAQNVLMLHTIPVCALFIWCIQFCCANVDFWLTVSLLQQIFYFDTCALYTNGYILKMVRQRIVDHHRDNLKMALSY